MYVLTLIALAIAALADIVTTQHALHRGGYERNRFIRWFMDIGVIIGWQSYWIVVKLILTFGSAFLIIASGHLWPVWIVIVITAAVAWRNTTVAR